MYLLKHNNIILSMIVTIILLVISVASSQEYQHYCIVNDTQKGTCWTQTICKLEPAENNSTYKQASHSHPSFSQDGCYPWMFHNRTSVKCDCSDIPYQAVLCDPTTPRTSILDCYCMTFNSERDEFELGRCLYGCGHAKDTVYYELPRNASDLNEYTCGQSNRDSTLCGKCMPGYSPLVYSYDMSCMNCTGMTYNWIKYIAVAYIPLTFFFIFVFVFRLSGTSPLLRSYVTVSQGLTSPICIRAFLEVARNKSEYIQMILKIFSTLSGIWNLDFFRTVIPPICIDIDPLTALVLDYAVAFYPLLLIVITYGLYNLHSREIRVVVWLSKPFNAFFHFLKQDWEVEGSVVKAFATFFLLSYLKILNVTADLLVYTEKYSMSLGEQSYQVTIVLYYDPSVDYFRGVVVFKSSTTNKCSLYFLSYND